MGISLRVMERVVDLFCVALGSWTLFVWCFAFSGAAFETLHAWSPLFVMAAATAGALIPRYRASDPGDGGARGRPRPAVALPGPPHVLAALLLAAALYAAFGYWPVWIIAAALSLWTLAALRPWTPEPGHEPAGLTGTDRLLLGLAVVLAVALTAFINRPDADDAGYLSTLNALLLYPDLPMWSFDSWHGELAWPHFDAVFKTNGLLVLQAWVSRVTGLSPHFVYYTAFPLLFAALVPCVCVLTGRALGAPHPGILAIACVAALALWGGDHRAFGNFAFNRLFQGKAVLVIVGVPCLVFLVARFMRYGGMRNFAILFLGAAGTGGLVVSAMLTGPVAMGIAALGTMKADKTSLWRLFLVALVAVGLVGLLVAARATSQLPALTSDIPVLPGTVAFGGSARYAIVLFAAAALPILAWAAGGRALARGLAPYCAVALFVLLAPHLTELAARLGNYSVFSWRLNWAYPAFIVIGLIPVVGAMTIARDPDGKRSDGPHRFAAAIGTLGLLALLFISCGRPADAIGLASLENWGVPKQPPVMLARARAILKGAPRLPLVLAPEAEMTALATLPVPMRRIYVRDYLEQSARPYVPKHEFELRVFLKDFIQFRTVPDAAGPRAEQTARWVEALNALGVDVVAFRTDTGPDGPAGLLLAASVSVLEDDRFRCRRDAGMHICIREAAAKSSSSDFDRRAAR